MTNKSILKFVSLCLCLTLLLSASIIPSFAVTASTDDYYVYQELTNGKLTLTSSNCTVKTYCELSSSGKIASAKLWYNDSDGDTVTATVHKGTFSDNESSCVYITDNVNTISKSRPKNSGETYIRSKSYHKVKITSYIIWNSKACDDIPTINL